MADISTWNLADVKKDLIFANRECSQRRLLHSAKWYKQCLCFVLISSGFTVFQRKYSVVKLSCHVKSVGGVDSLKGRALFSMFRSFWNITMKCS